MRDDDRPPSGCQHCGLGKRLHFQRWTDAAGWHKFEPPTKEKIRERMRLKLGLGAPVAQEGP